MSTRSVVAGWEYSVIALPTYYVEIRWKAGGSCGPTSNWTLEIFGASCG